MTTTSARQIRAWTGPAILGFGFRPFFFLGALWSAIAMVIWILMLTGTAVMPTRFDPVAWHAHEFLFGYLGAVIAGFLLTAVPNWTGRLPIVGWPLGGLIALWLSGRVVIVLSELMPAVIVAVVDLAFPFIFAALILREIIDGRNWRNLPVMGMLAVFALANLLFHVEAMQAAPAAQGAGLRLGVAAALAMICLVGGRIIPSFTRNWLVKRASTVRPVPPMQRLDIAMLLITIPVLAAWVIRPGQQITGVFLLLLSAMHVFRLVRWKPWHTVTEPLVWVLHVGYAFVPLGALVLGLDTVLPGDTIGIAASQHLWMAGAIGLMTLAVMTRATLGHSGRELRAGPATLGIYLALIGSVAVRFAADAFPDQAMHAYSLSALLWIGTFGGFAFIYGTLLLAPASRPDRGKRAG